MRIGMSGAVMGLVLAAGAVTLGGCTTPQTADVVRFHGSEVQSRGTIAIMPAETILAGNLEFRTYAQSIADELRRVGFVPVPDGRAAQYVALVDIGRQATTSVNSSGPRGSVSLGGFGGGGRSGIGGGVGISLPIAGGNRTSELLSTTLSVRINRRVDNMAVWEGRASTTVKGDSSIAAQVVPALARTLFADYPGPNAQSQRKTLQ